jgi:pyochelin biosynthesis protein PchC
MTMYPLAAAGASASFLADEAWIHNWQPRPDARLRLICFPPAGAGPLFFRPWARRLPETIEVLAVRLPGRESRITEPLMTDYAQVVACLYAALRPEMERPYAMFGHSMGALLAYGVTQEVTRYGGPPPVRLFISGTDGPGDGPQPKRAMWSDGELVADLRRMGGTPEAAFDEPELLDAILPILRADYMVCDAFRAAGPAPDPMLECPVSILGGAADDYDEKQLGRWAGVTRGPCGQRIFPGGHFFLSEESADAVGQYVAGELAEETERAGAPAGTGTGN